MYRIINKETGQVYYETDRWDKLVDHAQDMRKKYNTSTHRMRGSPDSKAYYYSPLTPELLAYLSPTTPIMDKVAGVLMLALVVVLAVGLGGGWG